MSKKLYGLLLPVLAIAAFASMSAAAQAAPQWVVPCHKVSAANAGKGAYSNSTCTVLGGTKEFTKLLLPGEVRKVKTGGTLTLTANNGLVLVCKVKDAGNIWNTGGVGLDEVTAFVNECTSEQCPTVLTVTAEKLAWGTELFLMAGVIRDRIKGIQLHVVCEGVFEATFTGELTPRIVNGTPTAAEFGAGSGELSAGGGVTATVAGKDAIEGESGEVITAE